MYSSKTREASHAGTWYKSDEKSLNDQLTSWLNNAEIDIENIKIVKAIIGPHAGYTYSGPTAAWAYKYLSLTREDVLRVFLLGPSHHAYFDKCGLSKLSNYDTPFGNIELDEETIKDLETKGKWEITSKSVEEKEHSLEMHLPYIKKVFGDQKIKLVPIMVGMIDPDQEKYYGKLLAKYFDDAKTVFCVSSDFCHWGKRFRFTYHKEEDGKIFESIEKLDKKGMKFIEEHNLSEFSNYLQNTKNTICGRRAISVLLNIIQNSQYSESLVTRFVKYAQSERVTDESDSSVSYASAVTFVPSKKN